MQFNLIKKFKEKIQKTTREYHKNNGWNFVDEGSLPDSDRFVQVITRNQKFHFEPDRIEVNLTTGKFSPFGWDKHYVYAWRELDDEIIELIESLKKTNL